MSPPKLSVTEAAEDDVPVLAALRTAAAEELTRRHGRGHWSSAVSESAVAGAVATSSVLIARSGRRVVATLRLSTTKPWAIDTAYFTRALRPLYLHDMAVEPRSQARGIGRRLVDEAKAVARARAADALRLDAYDAAAGAGPFYAKCGFTEVGRVTYRKTPLIYFELVL